jgi:outer membrane protease
MFMYFACSSYRIDEALNCEAEYIIQCKLVSKYVALLDGRANDPRYQHKCVSSPRVSKGNWRFEQVAKIKATLRHNQLAIYNPNVDCGALV